MLGLGPDREILRDRFRCRLRLARAHTARTRHSRRLRPAQERDRKTLGPRAARFARHGDDRLINTIMSSIFHYTDANGLHGILTNESFYATDYRYLNDAAEADSIRSHIMPVFEREIGTITKNLIDKKLLKADYYKDLGTHADILQAEKLYGSFSRAVDNVSPFF